MPLFICSLSIRDDNIAKLVHFVNLSHNTLPFSNGTEWSYLFQARTFLELSELLLALDIPDETQAAWREIL